MTALARRRCVLGLALLGAACFLACEGPGLGKRDRDVVGNWHGAVEEQTREASHDLVLYIQRVDRGRETATMRLDGEQVEGYRCLGRRKHKIKFWYETPSGRRGTVRGTVDKSGWNMNGWLRLEENGEVYRSRFQLDYGEGPVAAVRDPAPPAEPEAVPEAAPVAEYYDPSEPAGEER